MNKLIGATIAMGVFLISTQAHAVKHKKEVAPKRTVTRISFEEPQAKDMSKVKKKIAREVVAQSKNKRTVASQKRIFKSSPCLDGYISNNKAYCAVSAKAPALKKLKVAKVVALKNQRRLASTKDSVKPKVLK